MIDNIQYIWERLSREELLAQLAEEAMELGHAALKLRRVMDGSNPTPVSREEAEENLLEEIVDIFVCLAVLGCCKVGPEGDERYGRKLERWVSRLAEKE